MSQSKPPSKIAAGLYTVDKRLGAGVFGEVYRGCKEETKEAVAVKFEDIQGHAPQLEHEDHVLKLLAKPTQPQGFQEVYYFGKEGRYQCLVMELLGRSLEDRLQNQKGKFDVLTTVLIAAQVVRRIEYLHSKSIVHRDIKPENFLFGRNQKSHHVYLIDFGLSKKYYEVKHVQMKTRLSLTGTARYASINAHRGVEQSRRDDLEAIGHMLVYFLKGTVPWDGQEAKTQEEKYRKIREKKEQVPLKELCAGYPPQFEDFLAYARNLDFQEKPDYALLQKWFTEVRDAEQKKRTDKIEDHSYAWNEGKNLGDLVPLEWLQLTQPDAVITNKRGSCLCGSSAKVQD